MIGADTEIVEEAKTPVEGKVKVAMLDSGINFSEKINVVERANFLPDADPETENALMDDPTGHGTAAASLLASEPSNVIETEEEETEETDSEEEPEEEEPEEETEEPEFVDDLDESEEESVEVEESDDEESDEDSEQADEEETDEEEEYDTEEEDEVSLLDIMNEDGKKIKGVNPNVEIYSAKVLDENNQSTVGRIVEAIDWAILRDVNIIQMSFGISKNSKELHEAIQRAKAKGILLVAAAGTGETIQYPAKYKEVMAVGGIDCRGEKITGQPYGKEIEVVCPAEDVCTSGWMDLMDQTSGNSMAVPQVVGLASLLWQKDLTKSADFIRQLINATANKLEAEIDCGNGIIDCEYALKQYDAFLEGYQQGEEIPENQEYVSVFDEDMVNGCWRKDEHEGAVKSASKLGTKFFQCIKEGARWQDKEKSTFLGMKDYPGFHGYFEDEDSSTENKKHNNDYIASVIYFMKQSKYYSKKGRASKNLLGN